MTIEDKLKELYKLKRELLYHLVGMSYRMEQVRLIDKEIERIENERNNYSSNNCNDTFNNNNNNFIISKKR